jgi:hypothetical protein
MSKLRVSFLAGGFRLLPIDETVLGSFVWDTQANTLAQISLTCHGPYAFLPHNPMVKFSPPPATYPAGSLIFFEFTDPAANVVFQMNYGDRAYSDPPITPTAGGIYTNVPFDLGGPGLGHNAPGTGMVIVTETDNVNPPAPSPPGGLNATVE